MIKQRDSSTQVQDTTPMEQVRELLFGTQMKEVDAHFQRQEERFEQKIADAREALKTRLDSLENFMKSEVASLLHRLKEEKSEQDSALKDEQRERAEAVAHLTKELVAAVETFERKADKMANALDAAERELRQLMMTENAALADKIEQKYQNALGVLSKTAEQIRDDTVGRSSLSGLFTEVALKLSGQWSDISNSPECEASAKNGEKTPPPDDA
jgi:DNA anti-recombination protein RmuC